MTADPTARPEPPGRGSVPAGADVVVVRAWVVQDTGLAPAPPRHRRLPGALRHHQGQGPSWPTEVELRIEGDHLEVPGVGRWTLAEVQAAVVQTGPPVVLSLVVPGTRQLLGAPGDGTTATLLERLAARPG